MQSSIFTTAAAASLAFRPRKWTAGVSSTPTASKAPVRLPEPPVTYDQFVAGHPICWAGCAIVYHPVYGSKARITQK